MIGILAFATVSIMASGESAGDLAEMCRRDTEINKMSPCNSYILGVADGAEVGLGCTTASHWTDSVIALGRKQLADHPEDWSRGAAWVILDGLKVMRCPHH